jgi:GNAT superfamily N-acetyltransferase
MGPSRQRFAANTIGVAVDQLENILFRPVEAGDRDAILEIASRTWEGHDFLPRVFDRWVCDRQSYFAGMIRDGRLIGCARLMRIDDRRGWLEGLRVHEEFQGSGLGRSMSNHLLREAIRRGYETLHFSTYFRNRGSIAISEEAGFRVAATYSNLELPLPEASGEVPGRRRISREMLDSQRIQFREDLPAVSDWICNDWLFLPPDLPDLADHFPDAVTLRDGDAVMVLAPNMRSPECLEICWLDFPEDRPPEGILAVLPLLARTAGFEVIHLMLPEKLPLAPLLRAGFVSHERPLDVYRYGACCGKLTIS